VNVNDTYPSKWLRAADLQDQEKTLTISDCSAEYFGQGDDAKEQIVVHFADDNIKPLGLNKTNAQTIADVFGPETDDWIGEQIVIYPTEVDFQGKKTPAIRIHKMKTQRIVQDKLRQAKNNKPAGVKLSNNPEPATDDDDDLPF
jgi:hypothetical protein